MKTPPSPDHVRQILAVLQRTYPKAKIALNYKNKFQLLVAVILSAQCTDVRVNKVTPALFKKYPRIEDFAKAPLEDIEKMIFSTGFYKNKAKSIKGAATAIIENHKGRVPSEMDDLLKLPGVARKTANVILSSGFGKDEGIVVDTHMIRLSGRLGLVPQSITKTKNAVKIERELMKIIPRDRWGKFALQIVLHGRQLCIARKPRCEKCPLNKICPSSTIKE